MKTLLIATPTGMEKHVGEEYDDILEVQPFIEVDKMQVQANIIRHKIREMAALDAAEGEANPVVELTVETNPQYDVIIVSLQDVMKNEEKIEIKLPDKYNMTDE